MSPPDNLDLALLGARAAILATETALSCRRAEQALGRHTKATGYLLIAINEFTQVRAHLDWAEEILATRAKQRRPGGAT